MVCFSHVFTFVQLDMVHEFLSDIIDLKYNQAPLAGPKRFNVGNTHGFLGGNVENKILWKLPYRAYLALSGYREWYRCQARILLIQPIRLYRDVLSYREWCCLSDLSGILRTAVLSRMALLILIFFFSWKKHLVISFFFTHASSNNKFLNNSLFARLRGK